MKALPRTSLPSPLLHSLHRGPPMLADTPLPCNFICCAAVLLFFSQTSYPLFSSEKFFDLARPISWVLGYLTLWNYPDPTH